MASTAAQRLSGPLYAPQLNGVVNPLLVSDGDLSSRIEFAEEHFCKTGQPCKLAIPPDAGTIVFSGTINLKAFTTLECTPTGQNGSDDQLQYTGTGIAVKELGTGSGIDGCGLNLGKSTLTGIYESGSSTSNRRIHLSGGSPSTQLIHVTGAHNWHLSDSRLDTFTGTAIACDATNDGFISNITAYGVSGNKTSITLDINSGCSGNYISHFSGGGSGLHGLWVRNTINKQKPPYWLSAFDFTADCSAGGDGVIFDSSLEKVYIGAKLTELWAAGAGQDCRSPVQITTPGASGVHIAGGQGIYIGGSQIRANVGSGILIDSPNAGYILIDSNLIDGNDWNNSTKVSNGRYSGIQITSPSPGISISNNLITNFDHSFQQYGIDITSQSDVLLGSNTYKGNVVAPTSNTSRVSSTVAAIISGYCFGNVLSNRTVVLTPFQGATNNCSSTSKAAGLPIGVHVVSRLHASAASGSRTAGSGVITVTRNGKPTGLVCTLGVSTTCEDLNHSFTTSDGDQLSIEVQSTSVSAETLASIAASVEVQ